MGVIVARGDIVKAMRSHLRAFPELTALVGGAYPRISAELQPAWPMPSGAVLLRRAGGPPGDLLGRKVTRIDTFCYGSSGKQAQDIWAMLDAILVPEQGGSRPAQWRADGCRVDGVVSEADALAQVEPVSEWHRVFAPYLIYWWTL
jgi:hypothetical protein